MLDRAVARAFPCFELVNQDENQDEGDQLDENHDDKDESPSVDALNK